MVQPPGIGVGYSSWSAGNVRRQSLPGFKCKRSRGSARERLCNTVKRKLTDHLPRAIRLAASTATGGFRPSLDPDFLGISGAAAAAVLIVAADLHVAIRLTARVAPIIAGMRTARFEAAVAGIDGVAALLAVQVASDAGANKAAEDGAYGGTGAALRPARNGIAKQTAGKCADNGAACGVAFALPFAFTVVRHAIPACRRALIGFIAVAVTLIAVTVALVLVIVVVVVAAVAIVVVTAIVA